MVPGKRLVGGIAVDLQDAGKACQLWGNLGGAASVGEHVGHRRRRRTSPGAVVRRMRPELAGPGPASSWVNHRHRRLIAEDPRRGVDGSQLQLVEAFLSHHAARFTHKASVERSRCTPKPAKIWT